MRKLNYKKKSQGGVSNSHISLVNTPLILFRLRNYTCINQQARNKHNMLPIVQRMGAASKYVKLATSLAIKPKNFISPNFSLVNRL